MTAPIATSSDQYVPWKFSEKEYKNLSDSGRFHRLSFPGKNTDGTPAGANKTPFFSSVADRFYKKPFNKGLVWDFSSRTVGTENDIKTFYEATDNAPSFARF